MSDKIDLSLVSDLPPVGNTELEWTQKSVVIFDPKEPEKFDIDPDLLEERRNILFYGDARGLLWNPTNPASPGLFAAGFEAAQFPEDLAVLYANAKKIGAQCIQPTVRPNHFNLVLAATDLRYCAWLRALGLKYEMAVVSVSAHVLFYAIVGLKHNSMAMRWVPEHCRKETVEKTIEALWKEVTLLLIGAAQMGIEVIHLFFGKPSSIGDYPWDPFDIKDVQAMDAALVPTLNHLGGMCIKLGIKLGHEIHPRTMARNIQDFYRIWKQLDPAVRKVIGLGFDPSHFWDGEPWYTALIFAMQMGIPIFCCHAKNAVRRAGLAAHGHEPRYVLRGQAFCHVDDPAGIVSMHQYLEYLQQALVPFWVERLLPVCVNCEAEVQGRKQVEVTERAINYLRNTVIGPLGWHAATADFTAAF